MEVHISQTLWLAMFVGLAGSSLAIVASIGLFVRRDQGQILLVPVVVLILGLEALLSYNFITVYGVWFGLETLWSALLGQEIRVPEESGAAMLAIIFVTFVISLAVAGGGLACRMCVVRNQE